MRTIKPLILLVCLVVSLGSTGRVAADERLPVKVRVNLLLTSLTYDHNLKNRCPTGLRIGVVSLSGNSESTSVGDETLAAMKAVGGKKIKGLGFEVFGVSVDGMAGLNSAVASQNLNTLYLSPGLAGMLGPILNIAKRKKIVVITGEADYVQAGAAIGAVKKDQKPKLVVHVDAAVGQGANFDARLLRLADVIQASSKYQPPDVVKKRRIAGSDPEYPRIARAAKLESKIIVKIFITPEGVVGKMKFIKTHPHFEKAVREAIKTWRFAPQMINKRPIGTYTVYKFDFKLD